MPTITFNDSTFEVNHAVKGADYVHGYDENGMLIVSFAGVSDFSTIAYSGTYMDPAECAEEQCNKVRCVGGKLYKLDGTPIAYDPADLAEPVPAEKGGTGETTLTDSMNALVNALDEDAEVPQDDDYMVSQYAGGGETTTTYHRKKLSQIWAYIKSKTDALYAAIVHEHSAEDITSGTLPLSRGGTGGTTASSGLAMLINNSASITAAELATGDTIGLRDASDSTTRGKKVTLGNLATYLGPGFQKIATATLDADTDGVGFYVTLPNKLSTYKAIILQAKDFDQTGSYASNCNFYVAAVSSTTATSGTTLMRRSVAHDGETTLPTGMVRILPIIPLSSGKIIVGNTGDVNSVGQALSTDVKYLYAYVVGSAGSVKGVVAGTTIEVWGMKV